MMSPLSQGPPLHPPPPGRPPSLPGLLLLLLLLSRGGLRGLGGWGGLMVTPWTRGLRTWRPGWPMPPQVPMTGTSRPRSWRRNSKRPRPTSSGRGPLWPIVSHGVHPHPKGLGVRAVGVRAVRPPPQHVASPKSRNDYPHPTPPLQLYAESWCTARCTSWVYKCTMCSLGLQVHAGRGRIGAVRACAAAMKGKGS